MIHEFMEKKLLLKVATLQKYVTHEFLLKFECEAGSQTWLPWPLKHSIWERWKGVSLWYAIYYH